MVEPAHPGAAALVAQAAQRRRGLGVGRDDHPALPGRHLLVGVEGEGREVAAGADRAAPRSRPRRATRRRPRGSRARARRRAPPARPSPPGSRRCGPAGCPTVRSPTAAAAAAGSRLRVSGSTSQKTGRAPSYSRQLAEATKLKGLVRTSSPAPHPCSRTPRCSAAVPLETATASSTPSQAANSRSKRSPIGPSESRPERSTSTTSSSSRAPSSGLASGICCSAPRSLEGVLQRVDQRLPGGLDDVLRDADRPPLALPSVESSRTRVTAPVPWASSRIRTL